MLYNTNRFGPEFYELQEDFLTIGEFDDAIKVFDIEKILKIMRGINAHLLGDQKTFGLRIDITNPNKIDI